MIKKVSTRDMSREEWLKQRRKSIGGSDAAAILGLSPYTSAYALWAEKAGKMIPEDISDEERVRLGNDLEQYVADRFTEATGKKLRKENNFLYNTDYPFAHANPDRMVVGERAGFEAKTTSSFDVLQKCRDGDFPDQWYVQMTHYMMVTGMERWYLGVLCLGHGFFSFCIERDEAEIKALAAAEKEFWEKVENDTPPSVDGSESTTAAVAAVCGRSNPDADPVDLTPMETHMAAYEALSEQIAALEEQKAMHQAEIMQYMDDAPRGDTERYSITWKTQSRKTFDRKAFEADNGEIPDEYFKVSESRPFRFRKRG